MSLREDVKKLALSYENPRRFDHTNQYRPGSDREYNKWTRTDTVGFLISCAMAVGVILLLIGLISLGS